MRLRSECEVSIRGKRPERALNLCSDNGIAVRGVIRASETEIKLRVDSRNRKAMRKLADLAGLDVELLCETGPHATVGRFKKRYVLWTAPVLVLLAAIYFSFFIWEIDVVGNEKVSSAEILRTMDDCGFGVGSFSPNTDTAVLSNIVLSKLPELSFMAINIHGSKVDVIVREKRDPPKPITSFAPPKEVFKQFSAAMPLKYVSKRYTGKEYTKNSLIIGKIRINFYFTSGNYSTGCDIIEENRRLQLLGYSFPISLRTTRVRPWVAEQGTLSAEEAAGILKSRLSKEPANVISDSYSSELSADGIVTVKRSVKVEE